MAKGKAKRRNNQNEGGETSKAKRRKNQNEGGETSNPPSQREIGGGEPSNPPQEETGGGVIIDTDLLDCSICTYPLFPPLNQCINGHVACPSCWSKLQHKCHICTLPVLSRNIALEKVLESVHLPCTYANLGCRKSVSYSESQVHTDTCEFGLSSCPIPDCAHKAFSGEWQRHFLKDHLMEFLQQQQQQFTQLKKQCTQLKKQCTQAFHDYGEECREMPEQLADLSRRLMEQGRQLRNMSIASTEQGRRLQDMYIASTEQGRLLRNMSIASTEQGRQLQNMSIAPREQGSWLRNMYIAMHRFFSGGEAVQH